MATRPWCFCKNRLSQRHNWRKLKMAGLAILAIIVILATVACTEVIDLTIDNQTSIDLNIMHEAYEKDGLTFDRYSLGMVPAGQTVKLDKSIDRNKNVAGWTVVLKAEDSLGQVVWQGTWSYEEFLDLEDVDWKITIPPETD